MEAFVIDDEELGEDYSGLCLSAQPPFQREPAT
jgi:hypothetical protein